jgi:formylglycine-generating enzyme required for sulfatase activity
MPRSRRLAGPALVALLGLLALCSLGGTGCELVVKLDHFDDGCPPGLHGPAQVRIATGGGTYCIDSTEVSNAQYQDFLSAVQASPSIAKRAPGCDPQTDFTPVNMAGMPQWPPAPGMDIFPVTQVNWCQAYSYCAWAGKRLCGRIGGGSLAEGQSESDATQSQWFNACSDGGALTYPYGNVFDESICGGQGPAAGSFLLPVGKQASCVGGYAGIHDMSGNVWEWADNCNGTSYPSSTCHVYGGAYDATPMELTCRSFRTWNMNAGAGNIGVRCCADL